MLSQKTLTTLGAAALAIALVVLPAFAKKKACPKLCKASIATCGDAATTAAKCDAKTGKDKRTCKKDLRKAKKLCKTNIVAQCKLVAVEKPDVCSPSGAFLD